MLNAIKLHLFNGPNNGSVSADFRNPDVSEKETAATGDHHKTIWEIDPASDEEVALVLEFGPALNRLLAQRNPVGDYGGLRIGVWPGDGEV